MSVNNILLYALVVKNNGYLYIITIVYKMNLFFSIRKNSNSTTNPLMHSLNAVVAERSRMQRLVSVLLFLYYDRIFNIISIIYEVLKQKVR